MAPSALTIIRGAFLELEEVPLGCFVPDVIDPGQDYWPETGVSLPPDQISSRSITNLRQLLSDEKHAGVGSKLTHFFREDIKGQVESSFKLSAAKSTAYFLKHPKSHFMRLCSDETTKRWMEETIRDSPIFLIVGFVTVTQAEVDQKRRTAKSFQAVGEVDVTSIISSGTSEIIPNGNLLDIGGKISIGSQSKASTSFIAAGERIIGVQYRKVHFHLFSFRNKVEEATLERNQWRMLLGGDRSGAEDSLEVVLQDSTIPEDLELDDDREHDLALVDEDFQYEDDSG